MMMEVHCEIGFAKLNSLCKSHHQPSCTRYLGIHIIVCILKYQKGENVYLYGRNYVPNTSSCLTEIIIDAYN